MRSHRFAFFSLFSGALLLAACGGGGLTPTDDANTGGGGDPPQGPVDLAIHVSGNGSDADGDGTADNPYRSITRGLQNASFGDVVRVHEGLYDDANGERFPLVGPASITIEGDGSHLVKVVGGGLWSGDPDGRLHATMVPNVDTVVRGLSLSNPEPFQPSPGPRPAAIILAQPLVTVEVCVLQASDRGMRVTAGATEALVSKCIFRNNAGGMLIHGVGRNVRVEESRFLRNGTGVVALAPGLDFGGGAAGSAGKNVFARNDETDFVHFTDGITNARDCFWDAAPPKTATGNPPSVPNADLWIIAGGVNATGAQKYEDPTSVPPHGGGPPIASQ